MKDMLLLRTPAGAGPDEGTPEYAADVEAFGELNAEVMASDDVRRIGLVRGGREAKTCARAVSRR
jgi:hypothetical protein